jgi:hypothetical protein
MQPFSPVEALSTGLHFGQIIILCVSWYTN